MPVLLMLTDSQGLRWKWVHCYVQLECMPNRPSTDTHVGVEKYEATLDA